MLAGVINIGTENISFDIAQNDQDDIDMIESLDYPLFLGRDTFTTGRISFEKVDLLSQKLLGFKRVAEEYGANKLKIVGTTALREAENLDFILDQIETKTNLTIDVLDDYEEKSHIYMELIRNFEKYKKYKKNDVLFVYIGTGSMGLATYSKGLIDSSQNIKIGSVKVSEMLKDLEENTLHYSNLIREYLSTFYHPIKIWLSNKKIKTFVTCGNEIEFLAGLLVKNEEVMDVSQTEFNELFQNLKSKNATELSREYDISESKANSLLSALAFYRLLLEVSGAENILVFPKVNLSRSLLFQRLLSRKYRKFFNLLEKSTIISSRNIGRRYFYEETHSQTVEKYAMKLFDVLEPVHQLGKRHRLLLQVAAILHDMGKYVNIKKHYLHSYNIIKGSEIIGLTSRELDVVSRIAYFHSAQDLEIDDYSSQLENIPDKILITKMLAILRLADALDVAHESKLGDIEVNLEGNRLIIITHTPKETLLEEWALKRKDNFFLEVFGIVPELVRKV
jgi:exopolyphosphatase/guanosine-5'-triphosphate,3'-diphosphate pyrophosphatase